jgi:ribosome-binding factor A
MKPKRPTRKHIRNLGSEPAPENGTDPRDWLRESGASRGGRKTRQLCRQVERTLNYVLAGECDDDLLRDFGVISVEPAPDAKRLLVTVSPSLPVSYQLAEVLEHLQAATPMLRSLVAASIHRKRAPELTFRVVLLA